MNSNTSDITPDIVPHELFNHQSADFEPEFRDSIFYLWYNAGRPGYIELRKLCVEEFPERKVPAQNTLKAWIQEFRLRAMDLDNRVQEELDAAVIKEKVEMLRRHSEIGLKMQQVADEYINANRGDMTMASAIRLLIEGVRIERDSRGIPEALEKMVKMTDEELLEEVKKLVASPSVTLEKSDANP